MEYTVGVLIRELGKYEPEDIVKILDDEENELDIEFVDLDDSVVYIKGYLM
jgi:hypothetical protein